ncbi:MAG: PGPGW domain-containing protein [Nocardioides sp.]
MRAVKRVFLEVLGWVLVVGGIAALVLPGPGLLALFGGLALLSQQYTWAERRVEPVKERAIKAAADGVQTWPRITLSLLGVAWLVGAGVFWGISPPAPGWWPLDERFWLMGGWTAGITLIVSGFLALAMIVYAYRHYRKPRQPVA